MRQSILRELAVQSLQGAVDLEDHLQPELVQAAMRENITIFEFIRSAFCSRRACRPWVPSSRWSTALPRQIAS